MTGFYTWLFVNVFVPAAAPFLGGLLMKLLYAVQRTKKDFSLWAPYRDGQLGYVAVGWGAVGYIELAPLAHCYGFEPYYGMVQVLLGVLIALGGLIAAAGAVAPREPGAVGVNVAAFSAWIVSLLVVYIMVMAHFFAENQELFCSKD